MRLRLGSVEHDLTTRTLVMGMLRPSPPSAASALDTAALLARAEQLVGQGADLLDVGAAPARDDIVEEQELERMVPVVAALRARFDVPLSVDTWRAGVLTACCAAGAVVGNDPTGFADHEFLPAAARAGATVVVTHVRLRRRPADAAPDVEVAPEVRAYFVAKLEQAAAAGIPADRLVVDAGLDIGKTPAQSLTLLRGSAALADLGPPLLLGISEMRFLGVLFDLEVGERRAAGNAATALGIARGCRIVRSLDVTGARRVADVLEAVLASRLAQVERASIGPGHG